MNLRESDLVAQSSDHALVRAIGDGDREALGLLFERYYDELFAFADRMLGDPHAAADAVQEAFLRVLRYGDSYAGRSSFRTWMLRVARNACLDLLHTRRRQREALAEIDPPSPAPPPKSPDPRLAELREALDALPENRREVLILRRFHDLPYAEIGELCGISEGAARVRAHRALKQLRHALSSISEDHGE